MSHTWRWVLRYSSSALLANMVHHVWPGVVWSDVLYFKHYWLFSQVLQYNISLSNWILCTVFLAASLI